ncbi:hypothetical protein CcrC1_gp179 [Caulobacter phage C1]|nr:hypothetical protein CcrC1_gp179 [Caulobacter phage C1]UTU08408.1 hypothetical protein CcrC2_gp180 [Caulobacter phage C2]UTU08925.1 hypothetical protein CcrJ4_gp174 [Caulobacter phage J4]UTU09481.1 hypothetical protein CcrBL47_gp195 [Caulobacter phage BL47]UTU10041.1 hypothetical protein CcrRB23_gp179 [Caulobacter phage RB23]WGN97076.1 hypothetical protein [Bertelyvirus sp.]
MAALDLKKGFDLYVEAHQKKWRHDRSKSVGASEAFGCLRKSWFSKHKAPRDPWYKDDWGAMKRGDVMEEHWVEPVVKWYLDQLPGNVRLIWGGKHQRTLVGKSAPSSATPDGLVVDADDDALALYGIPSLGGTGCFNFEIKSIDPRVNLKEEKAVHRGQTIMQMGLTRELTSYRPNYALIIYVDASFYSDINFFVIPFDQETFEAGKARAKEVFDQKDPSLLFPEGKLEGSCDYCPYTKECARVTGEATPTDGVVTEANTESPIVKEFQDLILLERELQAEKKASEKAHKEAQERLKELFRDVGMRRFQVGDIKASITWNKGKKSLDRKAMEEDGIDLSLYEKEGNGFDTLRITERGSGVDDT